MFLAPMELATDCAGISLSLLYSYTRKDLGQSLATDRPSDLEQKIEGESAWPKFDNRADKLKESREWLF